MARCYICDTTTQEFKVDPRDGKTRPCSTCEAIIQETVEEMDSEHVYGWDASDETERGFGEWPVPEFLKQD